MISFTLLVDIGTIPFLAVVPIISDGDCSFVIGESDESTVSNIRNLDFGPSQILNVEKNLIHRKFAVLKIRHRL